MRLSAGIFLFALTMLCPTLRAENIPNSQQSLEANPKFPSITPTYPANPTTPSKRKPILSFRSDFYSRYLWYGVPSSEGAVWQPSATLEYRGVGFTLWGNFVLGDEPNRGQFNEIDLTLYYSRKFRKFSVQASLLGVLLINDDPFSLNHGRNSLESYLNFSYQLGPVKFFTDLMVELAQPYGALFWDFGVAYQRKLPLNFALSSSLSFGLGNSRFNRAFIADVGTQANLLEFSLAFPWTPKKRLTFTPSLTVSNTLAPSLRSALAQPTLVWGGLSIAYQVF